MGITYNCFLPSSGGAYEYWPCPIGAPSISASISMLFRCIGYKIDLGDTIDVNLREIQMPHDSGQV
jgi:hypothetical protein